MRMKEICLLLARRYRRRSDLVTGSRVVPLEHCRGICCAMSDMIDEEITEKQYNILKTHIDKLPNIDNVGYKFPTDKTGFLLRAKWLEKLSKKYK